MIHITIREGKKVLQMEGVAMITIVLPEEIPTHLEQDDIQNLKLPVISIHCKHSHEIALILGSLIGAIANLAPECLELAMHTAIHTDIEKAHVKEDG